MMYAPGIGCSIAAWITLAVNPVPGEGPDAPNLLEPPAAPSRPGGVGSDNLDAPPPRAIPDGRFVLEAPVVGVAGGIASKSKPGMGYTLGIAVGWQAIPTTMLRLWFNRTQTFAGEARIRYNRPGHRFTSYQASDWRTAEVGLGASYQLSDPTHDVTPYLGAGVSLGFSGYVYHFDDVLKEDLEAPQFGVDVTAPTHASLEGVWSVGIWLGLRLRLSAFLSGQLELSTFYVQLPSRVVSETLSLREARAPNEDAVLVRLAYCLRFSL